MVRMSSSEGFENRIGDQCGQMDVLEAVVGRRDQP